MKQRIKNKKIKCGDIIALRALHMSALRATYDDTLMKIDKIHGLIILCIGYYVNHYREIRREIRYKNVSLKQVFVNYMYQYLRKH